MAELAMPPGISNAVANNTMVTPSDILSGPITGAPGGAPTTGPQLPPSGQPIDAASMMNPALNQIRSTIAASASDLQSSKTSALTGQAQVQLGAGQMAQGQQGINMADFMTSLLRQQNDAKVYAMFGTTPGAPSATVAAIADRIASEENDIHGRREKLQEKLDQGFWDNPIQWLTNQVTIPFDQEALSNRIGGRNDDLEVLHQLAMRTQEGVAADAAAAYAITTPRLAAMDMLAQGAANEKAGTSQMQAANVFVGVANVGDTIAKTEYTAVSEAIHTASAVDQETYQKVIAVQSNARAAEMEKVQYDIAHLQDEDLNKKVDATNDLDARVRKIAAVTGINIINTAQLMAMADGKEKQAIMNMLWNPDIQQGMALSTMGPAEAIDFANTVRLPLNPGQDLIRAKLTQDQAAYIKSLGPTAKTLYTPEQLLINTNDAIKNKLRTEFRDIPASGGYYSPPTLITTLGLPGVRDGAPKLSEALSPLANPTANLDRNYPTEAKDVVSAAVNLILTNRATPAEMASEISAMYSSIMTNNDVTRGYRIFTLPTLSDTKTFNSVVPSEGNFSAYSSHNLANKVEMESYFTRMIIKQQMSTGQTSATPQ